MLRQSLKAGDSRLTPSPSVNNVLARLKSSFQQDKPASDRISESRAKISRHLRASRDSPCLRTPIDKSASEKKLKHLLKEANKHCRSSSVKALFSCDNTSKVRALKAQRLEAKSSTAKTLKDQLSQEFKQCLSKLDHSKHSHIGGEECFLDYRAFIFLMTEMNYLNLWKEDSLLLNDMWRELGGEDYGGFLKSTLLMFLEMVEGIEEKEPSYKATDRLELEVERSDIKRYKREKVFNTYERFRTNKYCQKSLGFNSTVPMENNNMVAQRSEETDRMQPSAQRETKWAEKPAEKQSQKHIKRPATNGSITKKKPHSKKEHPNKVFRVSFQLGRPQHPPSKDKQQEKENEKAKEECNKENRNSLQQLIHNIQQIPPICLHKPELTTIPKPSIRVPLLSLDVNLGQGRTDKIIIYEGDTSKQIANELSIKHQLDQSTCGKFQKILESHLKHLLSKIEEVEELTEDLSCSHRQI